MLQAFLVVPALRARVPRRRADRGCGAGSCSCSLAPASRWSSRPAGGSRSSSCGRRRAGPYIGGSQNNSVLEPDLRLQRLRPAHRQRDRQRRRRRRRRPATLGCRPAGAACSTPSSAARSSWLLPAALILLVAGLWLAPRAAAHRPRTRAAVAAVGRLAARHRPRLQPRQGHHPPVLHGRPRAGDRRAGRHRRGTLWRRRRRVLAARSCSPPVASAPRGWSVRPARPHADWHPWLRPPCSSVGLVGAARLVLLAADCAARVAGARRRRGDASRWRCSGRPAYALPPRRRRTPARSRAAGPAAAGGALGPGGRWRSGTRRPVAFAGQARCRRSAARRPGSSAAAAAGCPGARGTGGPTGTGPVRAWPGGGMGGLLDAGRRQRRSSSRRCRRTPVGYTLGRGDGRREQRGRLPAGDR